MTKPIVIELTKDSDGWAKGSELGYETESAARKLHGDNFKIVRHTDSSAYVTPAKQNPPGVSAAKARIASKPAMPPTNDVPETAAVEPTETVSG